VHNISFQPERKNWPTATPFLPPGLAAQQPTGRLPKRPARVARMGQKLAQPTISRSQPSISAGHDPTAALASRWYKRRARPATLENPRLFFLLPWYCLAPTAAAGWPAAGIRRRRWGQAPPGTTTRSAPRDPSNLSPPWTCHLILRETCVCMHACLLHFHFSTALLNYYLFFFFWVLFYYYSKLWHTYVYVCLLLVCHLFTKMFRLLKLLLKPTYPSHHFHRP
jgi:hypothetical protein